MYDVVLCAPRSSPKSAFAPRNRYILPRTWGPAGVYFRLSFIFINSLDPGFPMGDHEPGNSASTGQLATEPCSWHHWEGVFDTRALAKDKRIIRLSLGTRSA